MDISATAQEIIDFVRVHQAWAAPIVFAALVMAATVAGIALFRRIEHTPVA